MNKDGLVVSIAAQGQTLTQLLEALLGPINTPSSQPGGRQGAALSRDFSSDDWHFSILFPGAPQARDQTVNEHKGMVTVHTVQYNRHGYLYEVSFADHGGSAQPRRQKELQQGRGDRNLAQSLAKLLQSREVKSSTISLNGSPGRESRLERPDGAIFLCRIYMVGTWEYVVLVGGPKTDFPEDRAQRFFDSFKVTAPK